MKIKRKVQKTLPQLIEWGFKNDITNEWYRATNDIEYISEVFFNISGLPQFSDTIDKSDLFTIEVEEEITEDTEFKRLVCINDNDRTVPFSNFTIREIKDVGVKEFHAYIDREFKLIWRDGKLVE